MIDRKAIVASARRIIDIANGIANKTRRHDLVVEAAAIIRLCATEPRKRTAKPKRGVGNPEAPSVYERIRDGGGSNM